MVLIKFSTIDRNAANKILSSECYAYLKPEARDFILDNLGSVRVLDPLMHSGGGIHFENEDSLIRFYNIQGIDNPESFVFNCTYNNPNLALIKLASSKGVKITPYMDSAVAHEKQDVIDYYMSEGLSSVSNLKLGLFNNTGNIDFIIHNVEKYIGKITDGFGLEERLGAIEFFTLIEKKLISIKDAKYLIRNDKEKMRQLNSLLKENRRRTL